MSDETNTTPVASVPATCHYAACREAGACTRPDECTDYSPAGDGHRCLWGYAHPTAETAAACSAMHPSAEPTAEARAAQAEKEREEYFADWQVAVRALDEARDLLAEFVDDVPCRYDHHGYCQEHGLSQRPCMNERARALLDAADAEVARG